VLLREATETDRPAWAAFVASRPEGDVLQAWAWGEAGAGEPGERWSRLIATDAEGRTRGLAQVLARSSVLGRSVLYVPHGPLWDREASDGAEVLARLIVGLRAHARSRRGVVLKLDPRAGDDPERTAAVTRALLSAGTRRARHDLQAPTTRVLALDDAGSDPVDGWVRDARSELRRAGREGTRARVDRDGDPEALAAFWSLLSETAERQGFRTRSPRFLAALARALSASGDWFLALADHDGLPLAGAVAARAGDRAFYLYAASTRDPALSAKRGPYAAMAALQRSLQEAGTRSLDLWGVREPDDPNADAAWEGFSLFKRRFGGQPLRHPGTFDLVVDPLWDRLRQLHETLRDRSRGSAGPARA
jgi:lipid II:glycine glycyltransferase (peptidoglycan interpeptide bridge formation enzyme)